MRISSRRFPTSLAAAVVALLLPVPVLAAAGVPDVRILDNGLRVVVLEDHALPLVAASLWVHAGSKHEIETSAGYAHYLEHLVQRTGNPAGPFEYQKRAHRWGGDLVVRSNYDRTYLTITGVPESLPEIVNALADMAFRATLADEEIDLELASLHQEIKSYYDEPESVAFLETVRQTFPGHMYRFPPLGNFRTLGTLKRDPLNGFYKNLYVPNNMALALTGDLDPARAAGVVETAFGKEAKSITLAPGPRPPAAFAGHVDPIEKRLALKEPWVDLSFAGPGFRHPDRPALEIIARALGDTGGAPITGALQRDRLSAAPARVFYYRLEDAGMLYVGIQPATAELSYDAARAALQEIAGFKKRLLKPDEVRAIADRLVRDERLRREQASEAAQSLAEAALFGGIRYSWSLPQTYAAVTTDDLRRAAGRYLTIDNLRAVLILPSAAPVFPQVRKEAFHDVLDTLEDDAAPTHPERARQIEAPAPPSAGAQDEASAVQAPARAAPRPTGFEAVLFEGDEAWRIRAQAWGDARDARRLKRSTLATLDSGMKVIVQEDHRQRIAAVSLFFRAGSGEDPAGKEGLATFAGHLLVPLTVPPGWGEFRRTPGRSVLLPEIQVGRDLVEMRFTAAPEDVSQALARLAAAVKDPQLDEAAFSRFRKAASDVLGRSGNDPSFVALELFREKVYADHPYGHPGVGTPTGIEALTLDDVRNFIARFVRPERAVLSVAGDVDAAALARQARAQFGAWKPEPAPDGGQESGAGDTPPAAMSRAQTGQFTRVLPSARCEVVIGVPGSVVSASDFEDLRFLGTAMALRAFEDIVFSRRAAFSAVALPEGLRHGGSLALEVSAAPDRCDEAVFDVQRLLRSLALTAMTPDVARDVARIQAGRDVLALQGVGALASTLGYRAAAGLDVNGYLETLAAPAAPPVDRLRDVSTRYLKPEAWITVRVGPPSP